MAERNAVPSDLFPHVLSFLRENQLLSVAREFSKATGVKNQDPTAASLLDIFNNWLNSPGVKKQKLMSNGPSTTKKAKKSSSSSDDSTSEDGEPMFKRPALQLSGKKKTALIMPEATPTKAENSSSDDSDFEKDKKRKAPKKSVSVQPKPTVSKNLPQKKPRRSNYVSNSDSSSSVDVPKNRQQPPISKSTGKPGGKSRTATQKASNRKATKSSCNSSDNEDSCPEKSPRAKKMKASNSGVYSDAACTPKVPCKGLPTKVEESSSSDDSSDSLETEKAPVKSKLKSGPYSAVPPHYLQLRKVALEEMAVKKPSVAIKKTDSSDSSDNNDEERRSKITLPGKASLTKLLTEQKTTRKKAESSSDSNPESDSSEDETPAKTRAKASTAMSLVTKGKPYLASTKRVERCSDSNRSLSESEVEKKATSPKLAPKVPLPCKVQGFVGKKKMSAAPKDSSDSDTSRTDTNDNCNPSVKQTAVAYGKSTTSIAGMSPTVPTKAIPPKRTPADSSSTSDSSSEEEEIFSKALSTKLVKLNSAKKAKSSSSNNRSDTETEQEKITVSFPSSPRTAAVSSTKKKATKQGHHKNKFSHSEDKKSLGKKRFASTSTTAILKFKVPDKNEESSEESSSSEEKVNGQSLKKRKTEASSVNQNGKERTPECKALPQTPNTFPKVNAKISRLAKPFRRVRNEEIEVDIRVANNSFDAKRGAKGDWGEKANNVLKFTKGKSFRHEKTKKKRGSYCGGAISTSVNSIKFDSE